MSTLASNSSDISDVSLQILILFCNTGVCGDNSCVVYQNGWIYKTTLSTHRPQEENSWPDCEHHR